MARLWPNAGRWGNLTPCQLGLYGGVFARQDRPSYLCLAEELRRRMEDRATNC